MKTSKGMMTKYLSINVEFNTADRVSHAIVTRNHSQYDQIINQTLDYMRNLLRSFEDENKEEIERVGK